MADNTTVFEKILLNSILPSRFQMRKVFDEAYMGELAESIKSNGLQVPIKVWRVPVPEPLPEGVVPCVGPDGTKYCNELIYGECRYRAGKMAGLTEIDALTALNMTEKQVMVAVAIENVNRKDLHYLDEAGCFKTMLDGGLSQVDIAKAVGAGRTPNYINQSLKILGLADPVKEKSRRRDFSRSLALELTSLPQELQEKAFDIVVSKDLSVLETRKLIEHMLANPNSSAEEALKKAAKPKPKGKADTGFQFKPGAGKGGGIDIVGHIPEGMSEADADKVFSDSLHNCYSGLEAKAKEAEQNKAAHEAAGQKVKDLEAQLGQVENQIEHMEAGVKSLEKARLVGGQAGKDTSGLKQELETLKQQQAGLKQELNKQRALIPKAKAAKGKKTKNSKNANKTNPNDQIPKQNGNDQQLNANKTNPNDQIPKAEKPAVTASAPEPKQEESIEDIIKQANQQKVDMLNLAKEKNKTPEGRAEIEPVAKANGFQTPEEYIAKTEQDLRNQGLI